MDKEEILKELLADPSTRETLKKILLEDIDLKTKPQKKTATKKKVVSKKPARKKVATKKTVEKKVDENDNKFVDNLTDAVIYEIEGRKYDLTQFSKMKNPNKTVRSKPSKGRPKICSCGAEFYDISSYMCEKCLRGSS